MSVPTAQELLESEAFQGLLSIGLELVPAHMAVIRGMDNAQLRDHQAEAQELLQQLKDRRKERSEISEPELATLAELGGLAPEAVRALADRAHTHGANLRTEFPGLVSAGETARTLLLFEALTHHGPAMATFKKAAFDDGGDGGENACKAKCTLTFIFALLEAQIDAVNRMMACAVLVFPPLVMLCASIMLALMIIEMNKANAEFTDCTAKCEESGAGQD